MTFFGPDTARSVPAAPSSAYRAARAGPERFAVTGINSGQRSVNVALHGELDAATALILHGQLAFFHVDNPWVMVADMSDVSYVDLDGITAIVDARQALRSRSCTLTITNPSTTVRLMLELCDLTGMVER
jgi:anti-anti-sigma factor